MSGRESDDKANKHQWVFWRLLACLVRTLLGLVDYIISKACFKKYVHDYVYVCVLFLHYSLIKILYLSPY